MKRFSSAARLRGALLLAVVSVAGALLVELGSGAGPAVGANQLRLSRLQSRILSGFTSFELSAAGGTEARASVKPARFATRRAGGVARAAQAPGAFSLGLSFWLW